MVKLKRTIENVVARNQKGYIGQSMSVRARDAYNNGEMPKTRWTKKAIIEALYDEFGDDASKDFSKFSQNTLFTNCFSKSSWHHTGAFANSTDFYSLDILKTIEFAKENNIESMKNIVDVYSEKERRHIKDKEEQEKLRVLQDKKRKEIIKKEVQKTIEEPVKEGNHYVLRFSFHGNNYSFEYSDLKDAEKYYKTAKSGIEMDWLDENFWDCISQKLPFFMINL